MTEATLWLQEHANWPAVHDFFSDVGGPVGWWILLQLVILMAGTRRGLRLAWFLSVAALTNTLLKWIWAEPRPFLVDDSVVAVRASQGFGMPSGHAQGAMALWLGLWLTLGKLRPPGFAVIAIVFVVATGVSRVYYGVHSVAQVLVGFGCGLALTLVVAQTLPPLENWLRGAALLLRTGFALLMLGLAVLAAWSVYEWRSAFTVPDAWQIRFEATQQRIGQVGELGDLGLTDAGSLVLPALLAGYALLALLASEYGHRIALTAGARIRCTVAAIAINLVTLYVVRWLDLGVWSTGIWLGIQPLIALWAPLQLFGERLEDETVDSDR